MVALLCGLWGTDTPRSSRSTAVSVSAGRTKTRKIEFKQIVPMTPITLSDTPAPSLRMHRIVIGGIAGIGTIYFSNKRIGTPSPIFSWALPPFGVQSGTI